MIHAWRYVSQSAFLGIRTVPRGGFGQGEPLIHVAVDASFAPGGERSRTGVVAYRCLANLTLQLEWGMFLLSFGLARSRRSLQAALAKPSFLGSTQLTK